jgi:hypothetical protein
MLAWFKAIGGKPAHACMDQPVVGEHPPALPPAAHLYKGRTIVRRSETRSGRRNVEQGFPGCLQAARQQFELSPKRPRIGVFPSRHSFRLGVLSMSGRTKKDQQPTIASVQKPAMTSVG